MAAITPDRFDPLKSFVNVRLQQGVPLVDADVNELDDIRKFEVRAFLKWFVGDGVPEGNEGFHIAALSAPAADDFQILAGAQAVGSPPGALGPARNSFALHAFGRCIVDGLDVIIQSNTTYKTQPNFTAGQVKPIPGAAGPVLVYLDVWERIVSQSEDPSLVVPPLGTETCARTKREWAVRTRPGAKVPVDGDPDFQAGHCYYGLARIDRRVAGGNPAPIDDTDITDLRTLGLSLAPSTLISDVLGVPARDYRSGQGRPALSLRDAITALIREQIPVSPAMSLPHPGSDRVANNVSKAVVFDLKGGVNYFWTQVNYDTNLAQVFAGRLDPNKPGAGFALPAQPQIAAGPNSHYLPHAVGLPTGDILVAYTSKPQDPASASSVVFKRAADVGSFAAATEQPIGTPNSWQPFMVVVPTLGGGGYVVFFWYTTSGLMFRRRQYTADWTEGNAVWTGDPASFSTSARAPDNSVVEGWADYFDALVTPGGHVWAAYPAGALGIQLARLDSIAGAPTFTQVGAQGSDKPFLLFDPSSATASSPIGKGPLIWLFYNDSGQKVARYSPDGGDPTLQQLILPKSNVTNGSNWGGAAALDDGDGVWFFARFSTMAVGTIRWSSTLQSWGVPRSLATPVLGWGSDGSLVTARSPAGDVWLFRQDFGANGAFQNVYFQRILVQL